MIFRNSAFCKAICCTFTNLFMKCKAAYASANASSNSKTPAKVDTKVNKRQATFVFYAMLFSSFPRLCFFDRIRSTFHVIHISIVSRPGAGAFAGDRGGKARSALEADGARTGYADAALPDQDGSPYLRVFRCRQCHLVFLPVHDAYHVADQKCFPFADHV